MSRVTIKYGKKKHKNIEINATDSFEFIQGIIFSLTQVSPDRQKIIIGGKKLENDDDVTKLIKNKVLITVMGSNAKKSVINSTNTNKTSIKFLDDMTIADKQKHLAELPPGLYNLGNTCYLNSCIQCIKSVTDLKSHLKQYSLLANANNMASKLGKLMIKLDANCDAVVPQEFVQYFRGEFPQFASRNENGMWQQQDADEAYTEILSSLRLDNTFCDKTKNTNVINELFEGEFETKCVCTESSDELELNVTEKFIKLQCFIDINTRHINDGIKKGFMENVEKRSDKLGRNAIWAKNKSISALPKYISVQLVRFFWKQKSKKNAKILRKVIFPQKLDVYDFCNEDLKKNIEKYRKFKLEKEDAEREKKQSVKNNENKNENENENENEHKMDVVEVEDEDESKDDDESKDEMLLLNTGFYELCGIITHKGRSANSGHYIGYSKDSERNKWLKYDDEDVTEIKSDDIKQLYGGGDHQMAFLCIFSRIEPQI